MNARRDPEQLFYFGANRELFGIFHAAAGPTVKAAVLCPPLGQDQVRCHRIYRQLAHALVDDGIPVLRFDYFGTGDSAGASADVEWGRCIADTIAAADELRARSGTDCVVAFGARLGGSIALAASTAAGFSALVAWDPILDGEAYVTRLDAMQAALRVDPKRFVRPRLAIEVDAQWLGFAVSERLRKQLIELRLEPTGMPTLVVDSLPTTPIRNRHGVVAGGVSVKSLQPPTPWDDLNRLELAVLSHPLIETVAGHLSGRS